MKVRKMRLMRQKYGISFGELADSCGLSPPTISEIELNADAELEKETIIKVTGAFAAVIARRRSALSCLAQDYEAHRDTLTDAVEETTYEL